jgi:hypothetical protein
MSKSESLINKVLDECAKRLAARLGRNVTDDPVFYRALLGETLRGVKCSFVFTKGKKKGQKCGVMFCPHHETQEEQKIVPEEPKPCPRRRKKQRRRRRSCEEKKEPAPENGRPLRRNRRMYHPIQPYHQPLELNPRPAGIAGLRINDEKNDYIHHGGNLVQHNNIWGMNVPANDIWGGRRANNAELANVIEQSIMDANVDQDRRRLGIPTLGVDALNKIKQKHWP